MLVDGYMLKRELLFPWAPKVHFDHTVSLASFLAYRQSISALRISVNHTSKVCEIQGILLI